MVPIQVSRPAFLTDDVTFWLSDVLSALDHIAAFNIAGDVVNLSLYSYDPTACLTQNSGIYKAMRDAMQAISFDATWVVVGAGNSDSGGDVCDLADEGMPACINGFQILTTASISLSSSGVPGCGPHGWGTTVDYATVGDQRTLYKDGLCAFAGGTSMAAAVLSGILLGRPINSGPTHMTTVGCCGDNIPVANVSQLSTLRFDLELELEELSFSNVRDLDGGEDLYGNLRFQSLIADTRSLNATQRTLWSRSEATAEASPPGFPNGVRAIGARAPIATNVTYFELLTSKLKVSGSLNDDEGWWASKTFVCTNCNSDSNTSKVFDLSTLPNATASIQSLQLTNPPSAQLLQMTGTDHVAMTFAENGNTGNGTVTTRWRLRVTPHL